MVSKCGENPAAPVQLAVLRALLTCSTADHFVAHGDALMQRWGPEQQLLSTLHKAYEALQHSFMLLLLSWADKLST